MYAQHSVYYDKLPGYFIAFDILDCKVGKFLSVAERNKRLQGTGIPIVHTVATGVFKTEEDYKKLLNTATAYCQQGANATNNTSTTTTTTTTTTTQAAAKKKTNEKQTKMVKINQLQTPLEGIYIRIDEGQYLKTRAKVVRGDFIQTIEDSGHWSTQEVVKNQIDFEEMYKWVAE